MKFIWFGIKITVHFLLISCVHIQRQLHFKMLLAQNSFCNLIAQVEINSLTYIFISIEKINWINLIVPCPKLIIYSGEHRQVWILDLWGNNLVFSNDSWNPSLVTIFYNPRLQWAFLGPFWGLSGAFLGPFSDGEAKICHTYPTTIQLGAVIFYLKGIQK